MKFCGVLLVYDNLKVANIILTWSLNLAVIAAVFWKLVGQFVKIISQEDWDLADLKHFDIY